MNKRERGYIQGNMEEEVVWLGTLFECPLIDRLLIEEEDPSGQPAGLTLQKTLSDLAAVKMELEREKLETARLRAENTELERYAVRCNICYGPVEVSVSACDEGHSCCDNCWFGMLRAPFQHGTTWRTKKCHVCLENLRMTEISRNRLN